MRARDLWASLIERVVAKEPDAAEALPALELIHREGCLARRIRKALPSGVEGKVIDRAELHAVYTRLADCLHQGTMLRG